MLEIYKAKVMTQPTTTKKSERVKRGTYPPYINLAEAFDLVHQIYEQGGAQASYDLLSRLTGNSSSSSSFIKKIGALKSYGLATELEKTLWLTERGISVAAPTSAEIANDAKKEAFLSLDVFSRIYDRHKGKLLPADEFLRNIVEQGAGIPREFSSAWVTAFKLAAATAGLLHERLDGKIQLMESAQAPPTESMAEAPANDLPVRSVTPSVNVPISASGNKTVFELSDGRRAEFQIPFGITLKDAKRLKAYLEGLKLIIDAAVMDGAGEIDST